MDKRLLKHIWELIIAEHKSANIKHPEWPKDQVHAAAVVAEESGELVRAVLNEVYEKENMDFADKEAIQTAATCIRFLEHRMSNE